MAKTLYTNGTGAAQTTETADQPFIKYYTDEATAKAALSNLNIGDVISTHDEVSIENFVQDVVDAKDDALAAIGLAEGNAIDAMNITGFELLGVNLKLEGNDTNYITVPKSEIPALTDVIFTRVQ